MINQDTMRRKAVIPAAYVREPRATYIMGCIYLSILLK